MLYNKIKSSLFLLSMCLLLFSCKKEDTVVMNEIFDTTGFTFIGSESFVSDTHPTTGTLSVYTKADSVVYVFKNFKTDDGPNLEVWLVNDLDNVISGGYENIGALKSVEGDFYYRTKNTLSYGFLVVWCTDFSVKFGHAFTN